MFGMKYKPTAYCFVKLVCETPMQNCSKIVCNIVVAHDFIMFHIALFSFEEMNRSTLFNKDALNSKVKVKTFIGLMLQKISISNKRFSFKLSIYQSILREKKVT